MAPKVYFQNASLCVYVVGIKDSELMQWLPEG